MAENTLTLFQEMRDNNELEIANPDDANQFEAFIREHQREYESKEEIAKRYKIFEDNLRLAEEANAAPNNTAEFGVSKFSDLTKEETIEVMGLKPLEDDDVLLTSV